MDAANIRRALRAVAEKAGLDSTAWTPRELRHSFVSLMSDAGVPLEDIARLVSHRNTTVTELVYRKQLRPVMTEGAETMDRLFPRTKDAPNGVPWSRRGHFRPVPDPQKTAPNPRFRRSGAVLETGGRYWDRTSDLFRVRHNNRAQHSPAEHEMSLPMSPDFHPNPWPLSSN